MGVKVYPSFRLRGCDVPTSRTDKQADNLLYPHLNRILGNMCPEDDISNGIKGRSLISRVALLGAFFMTGSLTLLTFSTIQKIMIGAPLKVEGYVVPFFFGGISFMLLGILYMRLREAYQDLRVVNHRQEEVILERTRQVREANRKLNLLSSITRHDIMNHLSVVNGYLGIIETEVSEDMRPRLTRIRDSVENIQREIEFTRDYQDLGVSPPDWMGIDEIVDNCLDRISPMLDDIEVVADVPKVSILADVMLEKVFYNLVSNAYHHADGMSSLGFSGHEDGDSFIIDIWDNGCGIPVDEKSKVFEAGYGRVHGYGLFLAKEILSITDISIEEVGVPGEGADFRLTVPSGRFRLG